MNIGPETETVEHKRSTSEMREGMESIASILNKHGHGELYFGVRNDGEVVGQDVSEKTLRDISQAVGNRIEPRIYPQIDRLETPEGRAYVRVSFTGDERPYACDGRYRIRSADEDNPMSTATLERMMLERASRREPWDGRSSGRPVSNVDEEVLRRYVERGIAANRIPFGYTTADDVLKRLGLIAEDGMLKNAAAVCFAPSRDVMLRMGVFADSTRVHILDNQQVSGTLFSMVDEAGLYILNNTRRAFIIDGTSLHRREEPEIPTSAVREALFNAFCHRDYQSGGAVQIDIFWDHVDIYNPGLFPAGYTPEEYLEGKEVESNPRNTVIAGILYRSGDIEAYGTGLLRIRNACEAAKVPFSVTQSAHGVHVSFMRQEGIAAGEKNPPEAASNGLDLPKSADNPPITTEPRRQPADNRPVNGESRRQPADNTTKPMSDEESTVSNGQRGLQGNDGIVYEYVKKQGRVTVSETSAALDMPNRTVRDIMARLVERGLVQPEGANRNRTYRLANQNEQKTTRQ